MARLLRFIACLVACAVLSAAQCSASCLAAPCSKSAQSSAHQCHPSPEKRTPKCPLKQYQSNKAESSVDLTKSFVAVPAVFSPAQVAGRAIQVSLAALQSGALAAPPGPPLLTLLS